MSPAVMVAAISAHSPAHSPIEGLAPGSRLRR
jgi:hypothetical protein